MNFVYLILSPDTYHSSKNNSVFIEFWFLAWLFPSGGALHMGNAQMRCFRIDAADLMTVGL